MSTEMHVDYLWVPHALGGRRTDPLVGMRVTIRWQRYIREYLECSRDVEWLTMTHDPSTMRGTATLRFVFDQPVAPEWLREGNLIELLDGYQVIAVGRLIAPQRPDSASDAH